MEFGSKIKVPLFGAYGRFPMQMVTLPSTCNEFLSFMRIVQWVIPPSSRSEHRMGSIMFFWALGDDPFRSVPAGFIKCSKINGRRETSVPLFSH